MITQRTVNAVGLAIVVLMAVLLILVWQNLVPQSWYWPIFAIAAVLFLLRVMLRLMLARQQRLEAEQKARGTTPGT